MGRAKIFIVLGIAAIGAIGLALIVGVMTKHKATPAQQVVAEAPQQPMARVLVAKRDLPIGTRLAPGDMAWQDWPATGINAAFITDGHAPTTTQQASLVSQANQTVRAATEAVTGGDGQMQQLYGAIVRTEILQNEPMENSKLVRGGEGSYMAVVLHTGMRAISVAVQPANAAGGFILPGDHVDVVQGHAVDASQNGGHAGFIAQTLVRNVRVLAIDQNSAAPKNGQQAQVGAVATLEVSDADVDIIAKAKAQGDVVLVLRPYTDANGPTGRGGDSEDANQVRIYRAGQPMEVMALQ